MVKGFGHIREGGVCREWPIRKGPIVVFVSVFVCMYHVHILTLTSPTTLVTEKKQTETNSNSDERKDGLNHA